MIVKAIPAVSHTTTKNSASPATDLLDFSNTFEKKLSMQTANSTSSHAVSSPKHPLTGQGKEAERPENTEVIDNMLADASVEIPDMPQPAPPSLQVDPQLEHLQQLITQAAQSATLPPVSVVASPTIETANEPITADMVEALADDPNEPQNNERQNNALILPNQNIAKNTPQISLPVLDGKQGADNVAAEQHEAFLAQINHADKNQQENPAAPVKSEPNAPLPLTPENRLSLTPDTALRPHVSLINDAPAAQPAAATSPAVLNQALGTPAWQQAVSQQLAYFSRNGIHNAELRLHPEELGSLQINLRLSNDQAQVHFVAESHQVRAALEAAMPHLRTSLAESGINLGQSSVGADSSSSWNAFSQPEGSAKQPQFNDESENLKAGGEENNEVATKIVNYSNGINTFV
ncbi:MULTISPECIES: flagellar hook-length control protein FliK [Yersinia]|uniref:flagellar hook-length control protein FliK n=1 Tax=Yersinia TaxID=629 RepID=UPI0005E46C9C|nr:MULTISPECIES: flagellar hook-length control protein FliK [Yersinia]RXA94448.1 hypothetical protein EQP49_19130 [Yersinia sp. 2105 StPb PI]CNK70242.1 flagellar hook-length control protein FliK [Yersinia frederiksenii]